MGFDSPVELSAIDEERFGMRTARTSCVSRESLPAVLDFCRSRGVKLLIARCPVADLSTVQTLEREGFFLTDTLVYWIRDLVKSPIPSDTGEIPVRPIFPGEEEQVRAVAAGSFRGYVGHYHADPRLDRAKCDDAYTDWAVRSCVTRELADEVLVAVEAEAVLGFATLRLNNPDEGEGVLFGIAPSAQGRGIYRSFMIRVMEYVRSRGRTRLVVSTQITNVAVQKVWARLGCDPSHSHYTFHKWFD